MNKPQKILRWTLGLAAVAIAALATVDAIGNQSYLYLTSTLIMLLAPAVSAQRGNTMAIFAYAIFGIWFALVGIDMAVLAERRGLGLLTFFAAAMLFLSACALIRLAPRPGS